MLSRRSRLTVALIAVTAIWGLTFPLVQDAVEEIPTMRFLAMRNVIAVAALSFAFRRVDRRTLKAGIWLGVIWFGAYVAQTLALRTSTATNVAFITGTYVALTPVAAAIMSRRSPGKASLAGVVLATAGLYLLASPGGLNLTRGDSFAMACAALFAAHIIGVGLVAERSDPLALASVQAAVSAVLSIAATVALERAPVEMPSGASISTLLLTGIGATSVALIVQTRAQKVIPPTPVAVIFTMEAVFGGIFGYLIAGDRLSAPGYAGAALITAGVLVASARTPEGVVSFKRRVAGAPHASDLQGGRPGGYAGEP